MSSFKINVSLNGRHFFATAEHSLQNSSDVEHVWPEIVKRFPVDEGFEHSLTYWPKVGYNCTINEDGSVNNPYYDD